MPPSGENATFLFADIDARRESLARSIVGAREGIAHFDEHGLRARFEDAADAVEAAVAMQLAFLDAQSPSPRCGLHHGSAHPHAATPHRAAAVMAAAHAGEVLLSQAAVEALAGRTRNGWSVLDLGTVRLRDLSSERLHRLAVPGLRADFPPPRSLDDVPNNLPEALLSFVGRTREIGEVGALVAEHPLVTLVGMGGVGKTRLALHAAAASMDRYRDGVWLVPLGALQEGRRAMHVVAATLGVREEAERDIAASIAAQLQGRELLVILDNCEHVLEAAAQAATALLAAGGGMRVLATSREPLRLAREVPYLVPGLAVPQGAAARDAIAHYYSVRLFVDRAHAGNPSFELSTRNAAAIAALCNRLDGIPLAIEIAAARLRSMPLAELAARLRERFHVVTAGDPAALPRECTLWVMVDWSHELLPEAERVLFRRLGVFAGGWSLEAAVEVCAGEGIEREQVPALLASLAAHSLVAFDRNAQRYRMLETVREYAAQWLAQSAESGRVRDRHLGHFVAFTREARAALAGPQQAQWLARMDLEQENVLAAHEHAGTRDELALPGVRLVSGMKLYWANRGRLKLGLRVLLEALRRAGAQGDTPDRAQGLFNAGQLLCFMGRHGEARQCLEASLRIARGLGDAYVAAVLQPLGMAALGEGNLERARRCFAEALKLARAGGDERSIAGALNALAMFQRVDGRPGAAASLYEDVVRLSRAAGDAEAEAVGLLNLAMSRVDQGRVREARTALDAAMRVALNVRSSPAAQSALEVCAAMAALRGDDARAARFVGAAEAQAVRSGLGRDAPDAMFLEPKLARARAAMGEAAYRAALEEGRRCDLFQALREAHAWTQRALAGELSSASR